MLTIKFVYSTLAVAALGATSTRLAAAEASPEQDTGTRFVVGDVPEIVIFGSARSNAAEIPGSVDVVGRDQLENEHVNLTMDLFKKVPGVTFSRYNQGTISMDIAIRGFNAEGESPSAKLLIDGIPSNQHAGVSEMDALFPLELDHIEVVKGTNDPRYGQFNVAGNVNMYTRRDEARQVEALGGSFGTYEAQGYLGTQGERLSQHYFAGTRTTDGYRDNSSLDKTTLAGRWYYQASDRLTLGLSARWFEFEADAPGYLTEADAHVNPEMIYTFSATDGGNKETRQLSLHLDYEVSDNVDWSVKGYTQNFERQRFVRFTAAGAQQERFDDEDQSGLISTVSWRPTDTTLVNWGVDYQTQDNLNQRYATVNRQRTGSLARDHRYEYNVYGSFLQVQQEFGALRLIAGLRADGLSGDFHDVRSGLRADMNDYGTIVQPKFSALYELNDQFSLFANAGRSFQSGVGAGAYPAPGKDVDVSDNDGGEIGFSFRTDNELNVRLSLWRQTATDELALKYDNSGDPDNVGETEREGWELTAGWRPLNAWYIWGSYSSQEAILSDPGPLNQAVRGNTLHHTPDYNAALGVEYQASERLKATLFTNWQDDYYLDNTNATGRFGGYALTDLTLNYALQRVNLSFRVNNLFDEYYEYVWHDGATSLHSPGAERSFDASVALKF